MTPSPEEPGRHPFREELAARIRRRAFRPMALAFSVGLDGLRDEIAATPRRR